MDEWSLRIAVGLRRFRNDAGSKNHQGNQSIAGSKRGGFQKGKIPKSSLVFDGFLGEKKSDLEMILDGHWMGYGLHMTSETASGTHITRAITEELGEVIFEFRLSPMISKIDVDGCLAGYGKSWVLETNSDGISRGVETLQWCN